MSHAEGRVEAQVSDRVPVLATTTIVGDVVSQIGGDRVSLYVMLPVGVDPHAFLATPQDARQVADASVVFINGAGLETDFLGDLIASTKPENVVDLSARLSLLRGHDDHEVEEGHDDHEVEEGHDHDSLDFDPHVWMDPSLIATWTTEIAEALTEVDPGYRSYYEKRASTLARELQALDAWVRQEVAAIPRGDRILFTDHGMFGYFAKRYGFKVLETVMPGFSTTSEPSARHLAHLHEAIVEHSVPAIFVDVTASSRVVSGLVDELDLNVVEVYVGSLSKPDGPAATYQDFIRTNVQRVVAALTGS